MHLILLSLISWSDIQIHFTTLDIATGGLTLFIHVPITIVTSVIFNYLYNFLNKNYSEKYLYKTENILDEPVFDYQKFNLDFSATTEKTYREDFYKIFYAFSFDIYVGHFYYAH
jgi:hypothetical protein